MLKTKIFKALIITATAVSACSCNKFLEVKPIDGIVRQEFWQSKEQLQSAVIGLYTTIATSNVQTFFSWGEIRADMVAPGIGMSLDETNVVNNNILPTNSITNWAAYYRVINLCNTVLDFGPGVLQNDNTLTQTQLNAYLGEALTLRSLMYFYLVRSFGDVPLKIKSTSSDTDLAQLPKTAQKDVLNQIVADLKLAEGYAIPTYGDNASDRGRITKFTVNALQADVYLWQENYNDCITACDKVINSGRYGLVAGTPTWFNTLWVTGNSTEGIFEIQFDRQLLNPFYSMFAVNNARYRANPGVIETFYTVDNINPDNKDIRGIDVAVRVADLTIYKYVGIDKDNIRPVDQSFAHWMVYRYADILLMKAEACANAGRGQDALDLINTVRTRAKALPGSAQSPGADNPSAINDYILNERAREFAYEGKRWYDLLRHAKRNNYARLDILISAATVSVPPASQQSAIAKLRDFNSHYFPISQNEIRLDPNLIQNPFYR